MRFTRLKRNLVLFLFSALGSAALLLFLYNATLTVEYEEQKTVLPGIDTVPREYWEELGQKKIFWGHRELGDDIIEGIKEVRQKYDFIKLNIVETTDPAAFDQPIFAHAELGTCVYPLTKIDAFTRVLEEGVGEKIDIALLKFCYGDFRWESNSEQTWERYKQMMNNLKEKYPNVQFIHVTAPICTRPLRGRTIVREFIKYLVGRPTIWADNAKRQSYNNWLTTTFANSEPVFDLAKVESVGQEGFRSYVTYEGEKVYVLAPGLAMSVGNINIPGSRHIAEQLLICLANTAGIPKSSAHP